LSLRVYNDEYLSIVFQYSFEVPKDSLSADTVDSVMMTHSFVAQLPMEGVVSLSCDVAEDVGPLLTQVHNLGTFKVGDLAVSGSRKVAAIVSVRTILFSFNDINFIPSLPLSTPHLPLLFLPFSPSFPSSAHSFQPVVKRYDYLMWIMKKRLKTREQTGTQVTPESSLFM
jgi:hypothetical protein